MGKYDDVIDTGGAPAVQTRGKYDDVIDAPPGIAPPSAELAQSPQEEEKPGWVNRTLTAAKEAAPAFGYGALRGATLGASDRLVGLGASAGDWLASTVNGLQRGAGVADQARDEFLRDEDKATEGHGVAKLIGEGLGGAIPAIASGGISRFAPVAAAVPTLAESLAPVVMSPAAKMAAQGFTAGALNTRSPDISDQFRAGLTGAALGAGVNAAAERVISPLIAKATSREARGLIEAIVRNEETGASASPTAKKLLIPKIAAAVKELRHDPILADAARTDASRASRIVNAKISEASQDRPQFYADLDATESPLTVADLHKVVNAATKEAKNPSEEAALDAFGKEIDSHWIPKWREQGLLIPQVNKPIGVSSLGVRDWVSEAQEGAANTIGQINESLAKQRQDALKRVASEMWQDHLDKAAEKVPDTVKAIRAYDARYSALASMRKVFDERAVKESSGSMGTAATIGKAGEGIGTGIAGAYAVEHPWSALAGYASMQAAKRAPAAARFVNDKMLVPLQEALAQGGGKMGWATFSKLAAEKGLPQGLAKSVYDRFQGMTPTQQGEE